MKILCTGGAGFIGSHLVKRLHDEGYKVQVLDNYFTGTKENHVQGVDYITGSTSEIFSLIEDAPDVIYHLGEYSRVEQSFKDVQKVLEFNKIGTTKVLEYARLNRCKLIYAGSSTKFGDNGTNADASPYAWSKSSNVQMIKNYGKWYDLEHAIVYFYNVYGPGEISTGDYATLIGIFSNKIKNNESLQVVLPGTQKRNFTHVEDTVDALMLVGARGSGDSYGIGSPECYSVLEVAEMFTEEPIEMLPPRPGNRLVADVVSIRTRELGWEPKHHLKDYINDFKNNIKNSL